MKGQIIFFNRIKLFCSGFMKSMTMQITGNSKVL